MIVHEFAALAAAHFVALVSPGPDFFLLIGLSVRYGARRTFAACAGIAAGNALYILCALAGVGVLRDHPAMAQVMQIAGAVYLVYLGQLLLRAQPETDLDGRALESGRSLFLTGLFSALLNPKNALFYLVLFAVFVSPETPFAVRSAYGLWMAGLVLVWDMGVALALGNPAVRRRVAARLVWVERGAGCVLIVLAVMLAVYR